MKKKKEYHFSIKSWSCVSAVHTRYCAHILHCIRRDKAYESNPFCSRRSISIHNEVIFYHLIRKICKCHFMFIVSYARSHTHTQQYVTHSIEWMNPNEWHARSSHFVCVCASMRPKIINLFGQTKDAIGREIERKSRTCFDRFIWFIVCMVHWCTTIDYSTLRLFGNRHRSVQMRIRYIPESARLIFAFIRGLNLLNGFMQKECRRAFLCDDLIINELEHSAEWTRDGELASVHKENVHF